MDVPSQELPPPPLWPSSLRGGSRAWSLGEILALSLILILVAVRVVEAGIYQRSGFRVRPNPILIVACRYALGVRPLVALSGDAEAASKAIHQMLSELDGQVKAPEDRLRMAIVHGELEGREEATTRLEALAGTSPALAVDAATALSIYMTGSRPAEREWTRFHERYGWFADLALVQGKPEGDPDRQRVLAATSRTIALIVSAVIIAGVLFFAGLILLITGMVFLGRGRIRPAFGVVPLPDDRRAYLYAFAGYLSILILPGLILPWMGGSRSMGVGVTMLAGAFALGIVWPLAAGQSAREWRIALGLHKGRGIVREIFGGIVGYLAGIPVMGVGILLVILLSRITGTSATHPISDMISGGFWTRILVLVLASIWAPITEELMFRGALFAALRERFGWWISAPFVAAIFALIHPQGWVALPALASIAIVLAGIREWRGSIIGCIAAHGFHNTLALTFLFLLLGQ